MKVITDFKKLSLSLCALAFPMMGSQLINSCGQFFCLNLLHYGGKETLAAAAIAFSIQIPLITTVISLLSILSVYINQLKQQNSLTLVYQYLFNSYVLAIILAMFMMLIMLNIQYLLRFLGHNRTITDQVQQYFYAYCIGVPFILLSACNTQFGNSLGREQFLCFASFCSVILLVSITCLGMFRLTHDSVFNLACLGVAITAQAIFYFILTSVVLTKSYWKHFSFAQLSLLQCKLLLSKGIPIALQSIFEMGYLFLLVELIALLGVDSLANYQLINQVIMITMVPILAYSQACAITTNNYAKSAVNLYDLTLVSLGVICLLALLYNIFLWRYSYLNKYNSLLILACIYIQFDSIKNTLIGLIRGMANTKYAMQTSFFSLSCIGLPCSYLLGVTFQYDIAGVLIASNISLGLQCHLLWRRWQLLVVQSPAVNKIKVNLYY